MAEIVNLVNVPRWEPKTAFDKLRISMETPDKFITINDSVKDLCGNIDDIIADLNSIKNALGENTGSISEIDNIIVELQNKRQEIINKNKELITMCDSLCAYINKNKNEKCDEAISIRERLASINIFGEK